MNEIPYHLRDEAIPYSLPIILRLEKDVTVQPTQEEAIIATVKAVALFLTDKRTTASDGEWFLLTQEWLKGRIRKVTRRARASAWDNVVTLGGVKVVHAKAEILVLPPHVMDSPPVEVKKLQVAGLELSKHIPQEFSGTTFFPEMIIALNPNVKMSTGKTLAQVGHAVQLLLMSSDQKTVEIWAAEGFPVKIVSWEVGS